VNSFYGSVVKLMDLRKICGQQEPDCIISLALKS